MEWQGRVARWLWVKESRRINWKSVSLIQSRDRHKHHKITNNPEIQTEKKQA